MIKDSTILALQFTATIFMATDYFFDEAQRKAINSAIQRFIKPIQNKVDSDIKAQRDQVIQQWVGILVSTAFIIVSVVGMKLIAYLPYGIAPLGIALLVIVFMLLMLGGMPKILDLIVQVAIPLTLAGFMRVITSFLIWCPKGTVFGIGFIFLLASFACRYANLT